MFSMMRQRFSVAGLIATIALVFAMVGGAWAAKSYLITSKSQIKPSVLKQLKGKRGPQGKAGAAGPAGTPGPVGPAGARGATGPQGPEGKEGPEGPAGSFSSEPLPVGESLMGVWGTSGGPEKDYSMVPISFASPLATAPTTMYVFATGTLAVSISPAGTVTPVGDTEEIETSCPGDADEPEAAAGFLCVFAAKETGATLNLVDAAAFEGAHEFGVVLPLFVTGDKGYAKGSWAVTAG
jgi:Collagen triple helix repeat (20 copies)